MCGQSAEQTLCEILERLDKCCNSNADLAAIQAQIDSIQNWINSFEYQQFDASEILTTIQIGNFPPGTPIQDILLYFSTQLHNPASLSNNKAAFSWNVNTQSGNIPKAAKLVSLGNGQYSFDSGDGSAAVVFNSGNGAYPVFAETITRSGNGTTLVYAVPHTLDDVPAYVNAVPATGDASGVYTVTKDINNIYINYEVAPPVGVNNLVWDCFAFLEGAEFVGGSGGGSGGQIGYRDGVTSFSADGLTTEFVISHGVGGEPTSVSVEPNSQDAAGFTHISKDFNNITVYYEVAPPAGINNISLMWTAFLDTTLVPIPGSGGNTDLGYIPFSTNGTVTSSTGNDVTLPIATTTFAGLLSAADKVILNNLASAGTGETNTASNVGNGGVGVFKQKTGVNFEFKNINAGSNKISVTNDGSNNEIDIDVVVANLTGIAQSQISGLTTVLGELQQKIQYQDEGVNKGALGAITTLNFTGATITASDSGNVLTIDVTGGGGGGVTNLGYTASPTDGVVTSDTGNDATIPLGTGTNAGLLSPTQFTKLSNISVTQPVNLDTLESDVAINNNKISNATHTGDATGSTALTVVGINNIILSSLATGILKNTTVTGVPSIAVAGDFPILNQNTTGTASNVTGVVAIGNGGTGASTQQTALNNLVGAVTSGMFLKGNGTNIVLSSIQASDVSAGAALTKTDDTNVTLTLGGSASSALLAAASITVGWSGTLADGRITSASVWNAKQTGIAFQDEGGALGATGTVDLINFTGNGISASRTGNTLTVNVGATAGVTNLGYTSSSTNGTVTSDTGSGATLPAASGTIAGLMLPAQFNKLGFITVTQAVDLDQIESDTVVNNAKVSNATHSGDASGSGVLTLATVNSNTGTFGSATQVGIFTVNGKGLITAASNVTITPAATSITGAAALTKTDDTNVTLTLGGTPATALLRATSLTLGWTGTLAIARGGTGLGTLGTSLQQLRVNAGGTALEYFTPSGGGITSLNALTTATQTFTNDTNVTIVSGGSAHVITWSGTLADARIASAANWNTAYTNRITSLTTTGSSGAATLVSNVLNIPTYTLAGLGGQPLDADLTAIAALTGTSGFLKTNGAGTWSVDTATYLTTNQTVTLSGQATGSGTTAITVTLDNAAVIGKVLTGYTSGAGVITSSDSILSAIQKLNGNIAAVSSTNNSEIRVVSVNTTLSATTDDTVVFDTTGTTATLPSPANKKKLVIKNNTPTSTGVVTVSGHLDGTSGATYVLKQFEAMTLHSNGTTWYILSIA